MTQQEREIYEGNKSIMKFMQLNAGANMVYITVGGNRPRYHEDWNALMPVVEKIRGMGFRFTILGSEVDWSVHITKGGQNLHCPYYSKLIDAMYTTCVQFIQWYNTQKQQP